MTDTLEIFGTEYTGVTGIIATDDQSTDLTYIRPQGTKSISANGTGIDVVEYASVDVSVSGGGGLDIPTFTVVWDDNWETMLSVTCDKTYTECNNLKNDCWYASITDRNQTGTEIYENVCFAPVTLTGNHLEYTAEYNFLANYDIAYYPNGTINVVQPSRHLETLNITQNGSYYPENSTIQEVNVNVPSSSPTLQNKTVSPSESQQSVQADSGYDGLDTVTVNAMPSGTTGTPTATKGTVSNHTVSITPSVTNTTGYITGSTINGTAVTVSASELVSGTKSITANGTNIDVTNYASVDVEIGSDVNNQNKTVTPTESQQSITADSGYSGLGTVTVNAISSTYIGSNISQLDSSDLTVSGATVTAPAGYYAEAASKSVSLMTLPTSAASSATSGYTSKATIGRSTAAQYINIPPGYNSAGAYYVISAVANGSATAPASISGTAASVSTGNGTLTLTKTVSVTPSVTAGYVSSGTAGNSSVSLTASVTIDPTPTASGATVTIPAGYYTDSTTKSVSSGSATGPTSLSGSSATITTGTNTITLTKTGITTTPTVSAGYVSSATASTATVALTASVTVNPTPTASGATVTIPAGYYTEATSKAVTTMTLPTSATSSATSGYTKKATISRSTSTQYINIAPGYNSAGGYYEISAVANGSATGPSSLSGSSATVSTGTNTLTLTKTGVTTTPTVTAGYVSSATASTATVTLTASVTTKAATTITPTTTNQTIAAGTYLTGAQTIAGDADLVGSNILSTANIFGVQGTVDFVDIYIRSAAPTSSVGNDGDIYIQE